MSAVDHVGGAIAAAFSMLMLLAAWLIIVDHFFKRRVMVGDAARENAQIKGEGGAMPDTVTAAMVMAKLQRHIDICEQQGRTTNAELKALRHGHEEIMNILSGLNRRAWSIVGAVALAVFVGVVAVVSNWFMHEQTLDMVTQKTAMRYDSRQAAHDFGAVDQRLNTLEAQKH